MREQSSPPTRRSTSSLISELQDALQALDLASARVSSLSAELALRSSRSVSPSESSTRPVLPIATLVPFRPPLLSGGSICRGDRVRVLNPGVNQPSSGIATSARGSFIYLRSDNGTRVHRYEKNLAIIQRWYSLA